MPFQNDLYVVVHTYITYIDVLTLILLGKFILIFNHLRLCLATAIHNLKWLKITHICLIWDQTFTNVAD